VKCDSIETRRSYRLFNITAYRFFGIKICSSWNAKKIFRGLFFAAPGSNSRLCIGLQLQAQKLLMITPKFRWVLRVRVILNWGLGIGMGLNIADINIFLFNVYRSLFLNFFCHFLTFFTLFIFVERCLHLWAIASSSSSLRMDNYNAVRMSPSLSPNYAFVPGRN